MRVSCSYDFSVSLKLFPNKIKKKCVWQVDRYETDNGQMERKIDRRERVLEINEFCLLKEIVS